MWHKRYSILLLAVVLFFPLYSLSGEEFSDLETAELIQIVLEENQNLSKNNEMLSLKLVTLEQNNETLLINSTKLSEQVLSLQKSNEVFLTLTEKAQKLSLQALIDNEEQLKSFRKELNNVKKSGTRQAIAVGVICSAIAVIVGGVIF